MIYREKVFKLVNMIRHGCPWTYWTWLIMKILNMDEHEHTNNSLNKLFKNSSSNMMIWLFFVTSVWFGLILRLSRSTFIIHSLFPKLLRSAKIHAHRKTCLATPFAQTYWDKLPEIFFYACGLQSNVAVKEIFRFLSILIYI